MAGFATRLALNEGGYFAGENKASLVNRVRALVEAGELPKSVLQAIDAPSAGGIPTEVRRRPAFEEAFQHVHNKWKPGAHQTSCYLSAAALLTNCAVLGAVALMR